MPVGPTLAVQALSAKLNKFLVTPERRLRGVANTAELQRIVALPRRPPIDLEVDPEVAEFTARVTAFFRTPRGAQLLRPIQAIALEELSDFGGLFAMMRVGAGKTLITKLAAEVLQARRPILLIPAGLREKTIREFQLLGQHWRAEGKLYIVNYQTISRDRGGDADEEGDEGGPGLIERYDPDLIIADECQWLKDTSTGVTKKVARFMDLKPETPFLALSGTITKRSLKDYAHILKWCLKDRAPIPRDFYALQDWCNALDGKVREQNRIAPGALVKLAKLPEDAEGTTDPVKIARRGFRRRLIETPGVVSYAKPYDGASLHIKEVIPRYNAATERAFRDLRPNMHADVGESAGWVLPDGEPLEDGMIVAAHARWMALGFYYRYDPWPPMHWRITRAAWASACRYVLRYNGHNIDTEGHVMWACDQVTDLRFRDRKTGEGEGMWTKARAALKKWREVKPTFKPNQVAVWFDDGPLNLCAEWMRKHRGIVWTAQTAFAERLSAETGRPYYGEDGRDAKGRIIDTAKSSEGAVIASIGANKSGRNLQFEFWENLTTQQPTDGPTNEQYIGRTHREEQPSDEVTVEVLIGCREHVTAWISAKSDSDYSEDTMGLPAKILYCDQDMPGQVEIDERALLSARYWTEVPKKNAAGSKARI